MPLAFCLTVKRDPLPPVATYWANKKDFPDVKRVIEFPPGTDPFEVLERSFRKLGLTISPESAARCDKILAERKHYAEVERKRQLEEARRGRSRRRRAA